MWRRWCRRAAVGVGIACLALMAAPSSAGELEPPGSPDSTMKDLDEVASGTPISEIPFTVTESGFYYLTQSMTLGTPTHAIEVEASHVTIDLMGFTLDGQNIGQRGINMSDVEDVEIRNGSVVQFTIDGIRLVQGGLKEGARVIGVRVEDTPRGISLDGHFHLVRDCIVRNAGVWGIWAQQQSQVLSNIVQGGSTSTGITVQIKNQVIGNNVSTDGLPPPSTAVGIYADGRNMVRDNYITGAGEAGIKLGGPSNTVEANQTEGYTYGIYFTGDGNFYAENRCAFWGSAAIEVGSTDNRDGGGNWDGTVP